MTSPFMLGIDTGGTYTDAVLFSEESGVIAKAKCLTTRHDLAVGISGAVDAVFGHTDARPEQIGLVSLSTTLATNALVEGQGGRVCLVMIGFSPEDLKRDGLADALGSDPVIFLPGGHDVHGHETPLVTAALEEALSSLTNSVTGFAVAGYFATRNPAHELRVADIIRHATPLPATCSHELSSKLGGPRRALTTLLNARLIGMIDRLVGACENFIRLRGISAPMMVVRGDGALISSHEARLRPIETILSGPAASLVGARYLTGLDDAVVSDIGGTTTDVAILDHGRPRLDGEGAHVGAFRTMVEAVSMRTFGLGGDSEVRIDDRGLAARIELGPRRFIPLSLAATLHGSAVVEEMDRQLRSPVGRHDGRFAIRTGLPPQHSAGLNPKEQALYESVGEQPMPLDKLLTTMPQKAVLDRLVARGLVHICAVTPSDALHVLGRQGQWSRDAAELGLRLAARMRDGGGRPIAATPQDLAERIVDRLTRQSAEVILASVFAEDGLSNIDPARDPLIQRALTGRQATARLSISLDRPLVGLGASAPVYYPVIASLLSTPSAIPADADVANAIGAVVGQVRETALVTVASPQEGLFILSGSGENLRLLDEAEALASARRRAEEAARAMAAENGAPDAVLEVFEEIDAPEIEGRARLIEARIRAVATGRPRIATT